ncbi:MAG: GAF domain-containing protein [Chloroflexi bacterium]|nr:GAF domain-containing protein [Chloroflexota bacterium]
MAGVKAAGRRMRAQISTLAEASRGSDAPLPPISTRRALIAAEGEAVLALCREALSGTPYHVDHYDGSDGIDLSSARPVDLILLEYPLRNGDTFDLLRRVRATCPDAAAVILAEDFSVDALLASVELRVVDCIRKPVTLERLRQAVAKAMRVDERNRDYQMLKQEMRRGLERLDVLYGINRTIGTSFDMDEVMNAILQLESVVPYDSAAVFVLDERENVLRVQASRNLDAELQAITTFEVGRGVVGWVAANAEPLSVPDTSVDSHYEPRGPVDNPRSILAVPLRAGGKVLAVLNLTRYRVNAFTHVEARLTEMIASQAAQALRNAQLYQNACQLLQEESALYSLANIINNSNSTEDILSEAAPLVVETLRAESCVICLIDTATNGLRVARCIGISQQRLSQLAETVEDWAIHRQVLSTQEPVSQILRPSDRAPEYESLLMGSWDGSVSILSTPLSIRQRTIGVITLARRAVYGAYSHGDKDLLMNIASQLSVAIEELRLRAQDMMTLYELSQFSGTSLNLEDMYKRILAKVESLFDCQDLCLFIFDPTLERFDLKASLGAQDLWAALEQIPLEGIVGNSSHPGQPLVFSLRSEANEVVRWSPSSGGTPIVIAPMLVEGSLIGALALRFRDGDMPSEDRRILLASLAVQAALIIRNATLYAASQELAIAEERNRIAREFHDGVTQNLAHLMLKMQLITRLLDLDKDRAKDELERSRGVLEDSVKELRRCIYALRPVHLEGTGLSQAVERIATEFAEQNELELFLELDPISKLPSRIEAAVFRVVQEALNNIRKHAQASRFAIQLKLCEDQVHLVIEDDGVGFDSDGNETGRTGHFGVPQMKERAGELGGYLVIKSSPGEGTTIEAWIPIGSRGKLGAGRIASGAPIAANGS